MLYVLNQLRELLGDKYRDLLEAYLDDSPKKLSQMQSSFRDVDFDTLANVAHTMKGSSINLGAKKLSEVCGEIERLARSSSTDGLEEKIVEVDSVYQEVKEVLEQEMSSI